MAIAFLEELIETVPYRIHTIPTDNGIQFVLPPRYRDRPTAQYSGHMFGMRCQENGIEYRQTKARHLWTNGQVERMNRTIKDAIVKRFQCVSHEQLQQHLELFLNAYNYARRLKTLKGLKPHEFICRQWTNHPDNFKINPNHLSPGLNI